MLLVRGMHFSMSAGIGFIAVSGVAVLNGVVLITFLNQLRGSNDRMELKEVIRQGTSLRLRPVLMTALVASLGFHPMALSTGNRCRSTTTPCYSCNRGIDYFDGADHACASCDLLLV